MKVKLIHAFAAGVVAHAGVTSARCGYCASRALAEVGGPLHTTAHRMLPIWEEG